GNRRGASLGENVKNHALGGTQLDALEVFHRADRNASDESLRLCGSGANEVHAIGLDEFGIELMATTGLHEAEQLERVAPGANEIAHHGEGRVLAGKIAWVGQVALQDAGADGVERVGVRHNGADGQDFNGNAATGQGA